MPSPKPAHLNSMEQSIPMEDENIRRYFFGLEAYVGGICRRFLVAIERKKNPIPNRPNKSQKSVVIESLETLRPWSKASLAR